MQSMNLEIGAEMVLDIEQVASKVKCEYLGMRSARYWSSLIPASTA